MLSAHLMASERKTRVVKPSPSGVGKAVATGLVPLIFSAPRNPPGLQPQKLPTMLKLCPRTGGIS
jgi:hypothetical protein